MSIISCTSPSPSCTIFPTSSVTSAPSVSFSRRSSSPSSRTSSPRLGAGTSRQAWKHSTERAIAASASASVVLWIWAIGSPVIGERTSRSPPSYSMPRREKSSAGSCVWVLVVVVMGLSLTIKIADEHHRGVVCIPQLGQVEQRHESGCPIERPCPCVVHVVAAVGERLHGEVADVGTRQLASQRVDQRPSVTLPVRISGDGQPG